MSRTCGRRLFGGPLPARTPEASGGRVGSLRSSKSDRLLGDVAVRVCSRHAHLFSDNGNAPRLVAGGRCPLCRFPTYAPEPAPERLPEDIVARIRIDFPHWHSANGLCRQCADLYRAQSVAREPANVLI